MRKKLLIPILAIVVTLAGFGITSAVAAAASAAPAAATAHVARIATAATPRVVAPQGIGIGTGVATQQAIYQCPYTFCNQGIARPGDDIAAICYLQTSDGNQWDLVLNHNLNEVGFISIYDLTPYYVTNGC